MKKKIYIFYILFLIFFLSSAASNVFSQDLHSFGIKSGVTFSTFSNQEINNIKPGLQLGGFARLGRSESLFFKAELLVTQAGAWNWNRTQPNNINLYYLDLPLMLGMRVLRGLSLNLGIQPSVLITGTHRNAIENNVDTRNIGNNLSRFDYSYLAGLEYAANQNWMVGIRYNHGFVPIQSYDGALTINNQNRLLSNRILQLYVGYIFNK